MSRFFYFSAFTLGRQVAELVAGEDNPVAEPDNPVVDLDNPVVDPDNPFVDQLAEGAGTAAWAGHMVEGSLSLLLPAV